MERLTKRNLFGEVTVSGKDDDDIQRKYHKIANRLAELEDTLESGELLEVNNKPLNVEELKNLQVGDWVWIVEIKNAYSNHDFHSGYCRVAPPYLDGLCYGWQGSGGFYKYIDYGTKMACLQEQRRSRKRRLWQRQESRQKVCGNAYRIVCKQAGG